MERKDFIKTSLIATGGLFSLPSLSHIIDVPNNALHVLKENRHIRHGYYGKEFYNNVLNSMALKSVRIDRFENPEGDLLLFDLDLSGRSIRLGLDKKEFIVQQEKSLWKIDAHSISGKWQWIIEDKLALSFRPSEAELKQFSSAIVFGEGQENIHFISLEDEIANSYIEYALFLV